MKKMDLFKDICVNRYTFFVQMYSESISININGIKKVFHKEKSESQVWFKGTLSGLGLFLATAC